MSRVWLILAISQSCFSSQYHWSIISIEYCSIALYQVSVMGGHELNKLSTSGHAVNDNMGEVDMGGLTQLRYFTFLHGTTHQTW